jgi:enoyl-CoA hydratase
MINTENYGPVTLLRLTHGRANALDPELCHALAGALADANAGGQAVVLTGQAGIFSAGVDLKRLLAEDPSWLDGFLAALQAAFEAAFAFERPLVAAINGHAIAGGCVLAALCDQRLMASGKGRIGIPELLVGVPFPALALEAVRGVVSPHAAARLALRGEVLLAEDALRIGLIDEVVAPDELESRAVALATQLAQIPPASFALTKRQLRAPTRSLIDQLEAHDREVAAAWRRPEIRSAIEAWVARTMG